MTPKEVKEIAAARRTREIAELARSARARENFVPLDYTVAGNARIALTAKGRRSRSKVALALKEYAR